MNEDQSTIVHNVALSLHDKFVLPLEATQMCYRLAIFLAAYLKERHGIIATPVIGYADDGDLPFSHAWLDFEGTVTDISLTNPDNPYVKRGGLRILDKEIVPGEMLYEYHTDLLQHHLEKYEAMNANPISREILQYKKMEHEAIKRIAENHTCWRAYLDGAPDGYDFEAISKIIET